MSIIQANCILEFINQVKEKLVLMFDLKNNYLDKDYPWAGILEVTAFVVQSMYQTMLQSTSVQLVFWNDMILNTPSISDLEYIRSHKQLPIDKNSQNENKNANLIGLEYVRKYWCVIRKWTNMRGHTSAPTQFPRFGKIYFLPHTRMFYKSA